MSALAAAGVLLLVLMPLIVVHELGHYVAARFVGVHVERFCIGLGPPFFYGRFRPGGTTWALAPIPLGGYVLLRDSRNARGGAPCESTEDLACKSPWERMLVSAAGPLANLLLAVVLLGGWLMIGCTEPAPRLRAPAVGSAAERAGLRAGDWVESVGANPVRTWDEFRRDVASALANGGEARLSIRREDAHGSANVTLRGASGADLDKLGLQLWRARAQIESVDSKGAAARAGMAPGDVILAVDDIDTPDGQAVMARLRAVASPSIRLTLERAGRRIDVIVDVERDAAGKVHLGMQANNAAQMVSVRYGPGTAIWRAVGRAWDILAEIAKAIFGLVAGTVPVSVLAGPGGLAREAGHVATLGADELLYFTVGLSLNLGVVNLLPIAMLDGGAIVGALFEVVSGRPASGRVAGAARIAGIVALAALFGLATMNDFAHVG